MSFGQFSVVVPCCLILTILCFFLVTCALMITNSAHPQAMDRTWTAQERSSHLQFHIHGSSILTRLCDGKPSEVVPSFPFSSSSGWRWCFSLSPCGWCCLASTFFWWCWETPLKGGEGNGATQNEKGGGSTTNKSGGQAAPPHRSEEKKAPPPQRWRGGGGGSIWPVFSFVVYFRKNV